jgi:exoribonuclease R
MKNNRPVDLKAIAGNAMRKYGFDPQFPPSVVQEVNSIDIQSIPKTLNDTKDLRTLLWSSIDNFDSMDLDQLEYCEAGKNGEVQVKIAIADVDAYVPKHSKTDDYAGQAFQRHNLPLARPGPYNYGY